MAMFLKSQLVLVGRIHALSKSSNALFDMHVDDWIWVEKHVHVAWLCLISWVMFMFTHSIFQCRVPDYYHLRCLQRKQIVNACVNEQIIPSHHLSIIRIFSKCESRYHSFCCTIYFRCFVVFIQPLKHDIRWIHSPFWGETVLQSGANASQSWDTTVSCSEVQFNL